MEKAYLALVYIALAMFLYCLGSVLYDYLGPQTGNLAIAIRGIITSPIVILVAWVNYRREQARETTRRHRGQNQ